MLGALGFKMTLTLQMIRSLLPLADLCPAFRDDALQMLGYRLPGHLVAYAIRNDALRFDPPDWAAGHAASSGLARLVSDALTGVIADRRLPFEPSPSWGCARPALDQVFGIGFPHHFLHATPLEWLWPTEPQITKGFAHFLNAVGHGDTIRTGRIRALLRALGSDPGDVDCGLRNARVRPEAHTARKRIDLLIEWTDASHRKRGAIIEAKFGHRVIRGTLPAYRNRLKHIEKNYRSEVPLDQQERPLLFLVSPLHDAGIARALRQQRSQTWRWMSWRSLLLAYDRSLNSDHDDDAFRQFRRILWDRAG